MADDPKTRADERAGAAPPVTPRWVKYLLLGLLALAVIAALAMLLSGGEHGPGRHGAHPAVAIGDSQPTLLLR